MHTLTQQNQDKSGGHRRGINPWRPAFIAGRTSISFIARFAGPRGFEPLRAVLETAMLPLTSRPYIL